MSASPGAGGASIYREAIGVPRWFTFLILGGMGFVGFIVGLESTRNSLAGFERVMFYAFMLLALLVQGFVALNFLSLSVSVSSDSVQFAYGMFKRRFKWSQVTSYSVQRYDWKRYGGWGLRFGPHGRRAWSVPGVGEGVAFRVEEKGQSREYFVSSRKPAEFAQAVAAAWGHVAKQENGDPGRA